MGLKDHFLIGGSRTGVKLFSFELRKWSLGCRVETVRLRTLGLRLVVVASMFSRYPEENPASDASAKSKRFALTSHRHVMWELSRIGVPDIEPQTRRC